MPPVKPTEAELADRALCATKVLKKAIADGAKIEAETENRSTGSRSKYKRAYDGAVEALDILLNRAHGKTKDAPKASPAKRKRAVVDPVPARRVRGSANAKSNVVPIAKAPSAPKKSTGRKVGGRRG